jgi:hypothetical protein
MKGKGKIAAIAVLLTLSLSSARSAHAWDTWGQITLYLQTGMSEQQVIKTIGQWPDKVEQSTCGNLTDQGGWSCRILVWGNFYGGLRITEEWYNGQWVASHWRVYP